MELRALPELEEKILNELKESLLKRFPGRIKLVRLFGSKARGDYDGESDTDLLIVVDEADPQLIREIDDIDYEISEKYDFQTLNSILVMSEEKYSHLNTSFIRNIQREGIDLWNSYLEEEIRMFLERSERSIRVAHLLFEGELYGEATSRAYYAMFYAVKAILLSKQIEVSKHSGVISNFGHHFVKPGLIDDKYGKMLGEAFKYRRIADYEVSVEISKEEAALHIENAEKFLGGMERFLGAEGKGEIA